MDRPCVIELAPGAEALGLSHMLRDLIGQNMDQHPEKRADFSKLKIRIGLVIRDADIRMTLDFDNGCLTLHAGMRERAAIRVETESDVVMSLSNQTIKWGLPYPFDDAGREIFRAVKSGRLKVNGALGHLPSMLRFTRVMSVR